MKKAFTLIELLVVIAIIAILAAILFPVFAQAKLAAKKTTSVSNIKQQSLSILMYTGDYDDTYPHNDDCVANSSLDPKYNGIANPTAADMTAHCSAFTTLGGASWRMNHYEWEKWVLPYVKSVQMFIHPSYALIKGTNVDANGAPTGFDQGEIANGYALNLAITGAQNTWNYPGPPYTNTAAIRNSFVGGTTTGVPSPAEAMILTEQYFHVVVGGFETPHNGPTMTFNPLAIREHWEAMFYKSVKPATNPDCSTAVGTIDPVKVPFGVVPVGFCDGHVKAMAPGDIIGKTPTHAQYLGVPYSSSVCAPTAAYYNSAVDTLPARAQAWPFWGLQ